MIEVTQLDRYQLVIKFFFGQCCGQFHTNVVTSETVHGPAAISLLKQHLSLLTHMLGIKSMRLFVRQLQ